MFGFKPNHNHYHLRLKVISSRYSGKGRPKKSDYDIKDFFDVQVEMNNITFK